MRNYLFILSIIFSIFFSGNRLFAQSSDGGTLMEPVDTVCYQNNQGVLRLNGEIGDALYWEYSTSGSSPWMTISNTTDSLEYYDLKQTTYFRAIVKFNAEPQDTSTVAVVHVSPLSSGGTLSGEQTVCKDNNTGILTLSNYTGKIDHWLYSEDLGSTWNTINHTDASYTFNNLSVTNHFRVVVKSGACSSDTSNTVVVSVSPSTNAGVLIGIDTVCYDNNAGEITLSGYTGDIVRWESSETGDNPWAAISYTNDTLPYANTVQTKHYRAVVQSGACGAKSSNTVTIKVSPPSKGGIVSGSDEVCAEQNSGTLVLSDYTGEILNWQYSTDYGTTWDNLSNINHTLNYSGLKQTTIYRAVVRSGACDTAYSEIATITVNPLPEVNFSFDTVCRTQPTTFVNTSTISNGSILSYSWDFGNGNGNNAVNPIYTYPDDGTFNVKLTATSDKGCINDTSFTAKVNPTPVVGFSFDNQCDQIPVDFSNTSFSTIDGDISNHWGFDDSGAQSIETEPSHQFSESGTYDVKLIVTEDATGCKDSVTQEVKIYPRTIPDFDFTNICLGNEMDFTNKTTLSEGSTNYFWTFGDGNSSSERNPKNLYSADGSYQVLLTATTDHNCIDTISKKILVYQQPETDFMVDDICYTDTASFINNTTIDPDSVNYQWDFGDGSTSAEQNPDKYYTAPGTYSVSLNVVTNNNCSDKQNKNITVYALPSVNFDAEDECIYNPVTFANLSTGQSETLNYQWSFGDDGTSTEKNPVYQFSMPGSYDVKLIAVSGSMCSDSVTKTVNIFPEPEPDFEVENVCDGNPSYFFNQSNITAGTINSYRWNFGDETASEQENPVHQFLNPGTYQVSLTVNSAKGCIATINKPVTVDYLPLANFTINNVCQGNPVNPSNLSSIEEGNLTYHWNFGDGSTATIPEPNHTYALPGTYPVTLKVSSDNHCTDSLVRFVQVFELPNAYAGEDVSVSKGEKIRLNASGGSIYSWYPSGSLSNAFVSNPLASPSETTDYIVQVEDLNSCVNYDTLTVTVIDDYKITPNNIITPDDNGINDNWVIENIESYGNCTVFIFDRWGNEVYTKKGYDNSWDGKNSNGDILPDGTYYYIVKFDDSDVVYKGAISLLRNK